MEEGRNEVTFDVTLETEWRWRGEAFSPVEGIRQVMEEPGKGQRKSPGREQGSTACLPFLACPPCIPEPWIWAESQLICPGAAPSPLGMAGPGL